MRFPPIRKICAVLAVFLAVQGSFAQSPAPSATSQPQLAAPVKSPVKARRGRRLGHRVGPKKVIVHRGGASEAPTEMAPAVSQRKSEAERAKSDRLLSATQANLKKLSGIKLTDDQQSLVNQIQQFMQQSRAALDAGDLTQGYNLASKANVLSEEFNKH